MSTPAQRFCPKCAQTQHADGAERCRTCDVELVPLLDEAGALSREFLMARDSCCDSGCRNCPYPGPKDSREKTCERCGKGFPCQASACWCAELQLAPTTLRWLKQNYGECLCPACLNEFAAL